MNVIVDTSSWIEHFQHSTEFIDEALKESRVYLPPIVATELITGLKSGPAKNLESFLSDLPLCETPFEHWIRCGHLRASLLKRGFTVSTPDSHIVQCALDIDAILVSKDRIFFKIAKLVGLKLYSGR